MLSYDESVFFFFFTPLCSLEPQGIPCRYQDTFSLVGPLEMSQSFIGAAAPQPESSPSVRSFPAQALSQRERPFHSLSSAINQPSCLICACNVCPALPSYCSRQLYGQHCVGISILKSSHTRHYYQDCVLQLKSVRSRLEEGVC